LQEIKENVEEEIRGTDNLRGVEGAKADMDTYDGLQV